MANFILVTFVVLSIVLSVHGHGRLNKPAGRATLWRFPEYQQFNPVADYNDNQAFCGGVQRQYGQNGGLCGICGDPYDEAQPRSHEGGGIYGKGIITGEYRAGQVIQVHVELTAAHLGYFEFRLCPHNSPNTPATQECLDRNLLRLANGGYRHPVPTFTASQYYVDVVLPEGVRCEQCVLQWHYYTGNSYGVCADGTNQLGCGNQEVFRGCADITIR